MIFQIDYKSGGKYDDYFNYNKNYNLVDYYRYDDKLIEKFLIDYGYLNIFKNFKIETRFQYAHNAILCDVLRVMILYEIGGIYLDADVKFQEEIVNLDNDLLDKFGNKTIMIDNKSFFFIRAPKHSKYIKMILDSYLKCKYLSVDVFMLKKHHLLEYLNEVAIITPGFLEKYFIHFQVTTDENHKHNIRF